MSNGETSSKTIADFFAVFGLPQKLRLDVAALEKQFYAMSRRLHPDRFVNRPPEEQEEVLRQSSLLNDAYRTLRDPVGRTQHLLALQGVEMEEQSKAATDAARATGSEKKQAVPPELLEEVFELNMQLTEMRMGEDDPQLRKDLEAAKSSFDAKMGETQKELEQRWDEWDVALDAGDDGSKEHAKDGMVALLNRGRYLRNLLRDVDEALGG